MVLDGTNQQKCVLSTSTNILKGLAREIFYQKINKNMCMLTSPCAVYNYPNEMWCLAGSQEFQKLLAAGEAPRNITRYYKFLSEQEKFKAVAKRLPEVKIVPSKEVCTRLH